MTTTPASAPGSSGAPAEDGGGAAPRAPTLSDATEIAGKSIGTGVAAGTGDVAGEIKDRLPITAGAVEKAGQLSGETVSAAAEVVADAIRVLPLEDLGSGDGTGGRRR